MSSMVQKLTGALALGPVQYGGSVAVYESLRVGKTYLKAVKVVGQLDTLLRNGEGCTLWVATIRNAVRLRAIRGIRFSCLTPITKLEFAICANTRSLSRCWQSGPKWLDAGNICCVLAPALMSSRKLLWPSGHNRSGSRA